MMEDSSDCPWNDLNGLPFWKDISTIAPAFDCSVAYQIRNGSTIKFWHDNWCSKPLKYDFPNLYRTAQNKNYSVRQCIIEAGWEIHSTVAHYVAPVERDRLLSRLQHLHTMQSHDSIVWLRSLTENFSVSSAYKLLSHTPSPVNYISNIWTIEAPLRVLVFTWLLLSNRLTTIDNLVCRGWHLPNMCTMCKAHEKTASHLFQECLVAKELRCYILTAFGTHCSIPHKFVSADSFHMLMNPVQELTAAQWELTTCFVI